MIRAYIAYLLIENHIPSITRQNEKANSDQHITRFGKSGHIGVEQAHTRIIEAGNCVESPNPPMLVSCDDP